MRNGEWVILAVAVLLIVLVLGLIVWSYHDFADRCERAGGMLMTEEVCVAPGTQVLMSR